MRRYPRSGSPWPAAAPTRGPPPPYWAGHADGDRSSGAGPGLDASAAALRAARTTRARPGGAVAVRVQPAGLGLPSRPAAGSPDVAAPRPRGATRAARRLGRRTPRQQRKPPQHLAEQQIEQSKGHAPIIAARWPPRRTRSSAPTTEFLAPTGQPSDQYVCYWQCSAGSRARPKHRSESALLRVRDELRSGTLGGWPEKGLQLFPELLHDAEPCPWGLETRARSPRPATGSARPPRVSTKP